jgi:antitoxin VapB
MVKTRLFNSNRSQAVRLPKDVAFPDGVRDVVIVREGNRRVVLAADSVWDDFFDSPGIDIGEHERLPHQKREDF